MGWNLRLNELDMNSYEHVVQNVWILFNVHWWVRRRWDSLVWVSQVDCFATAVHRDFGFLLWWSHAWDRVTLIGPNRLAESLDWREGACGPPNLWRHVWLRRGGLLELSVVHHWQVDCVVGHQVESLYVRLHLQVHQPYQHQ